MPEFWSAGGALATLLQPLAALHGGVGTLRRSLASPWHAPLPVLCVGNLVAGGAGKTPIALSLATLLAGQGRRPHIVTRGYGGRLRGPTAVEPARHAASEVGDEALLLAAAAPCWIARDRIAGVRRAHAAGADLVLLDDGFQNPSLAKDLSLVVVDGGYGFGNARLMPAGPLRETVADGLGRATALVLIGEDRHGIAARLPPGLPVLHARLTPRDATDLVGRRVLAFAGIGRPTKFYASLTELGAEIVERHDFPDHHPYRESELRRLLAAAQAQAAIPVTTAKDWVRLPAALRDAVRILDIAVEWREETELLGLLRRFGLVPAGSGRDHGRG